MSFTVSLIWFGDLPHIGNGVLKVWLFEALDLDSFITRKRRRLSLVHDSDKGYLGQFQIHLIGNILLCEKSVSPWSPPCLVNYQRASLPRSFSNRVVDILAFRSYSPLLPTGKLEWGGGKWRTATKTVLGFCTMFVFFVFVLKPKLISRSPSYI